MRTISPTNPDVNGCRAGLLPGENFQSFESSGQPTAVNQLLTPMTIWHRSRMLDSKNNLIWLHRQRSESMKRNSLWLILSLAFALALMSGCQKAAENANTMAPAASPTAETINTAAIETELIRIENDWPRVIKQKDVEAVKRVEADDGIFVYPDGTIGDKATDVKDMENGALSADSWEVS